MKKLALILFTITSLNAFGQAIDLAQLLKSNQITAVNRNISQNETSAIELDAREGDGLAILNLVEFKKGTIHLDIQGENAPGKSFVGLAFNINNDTTYEAVYFRPFNFLANEPTKRSHMVQYIYHPIFTWFKLRQERTGEFEGVLLTPQLPDSWFTIKINLTDDKVTVFVNEQRKPVLEIERLTDSTSNKIGLWTGNGSSGRFRNLVLVKEE